MKFSSKVFALLAAALPFAAALPAAPAAAPNAPSEVIPGKYIVTLKDSLSPEAVEAHTAWVEGVHKRNIAKRDAAEAPAGIEQTYDGNFVGYAGGFDDATIAEIEASDEVEAVEADQVWHILDTQNGATYGLGSLSSRAPGSTSYRYASNPGAGAFGYVVDTGINTAHQEFQGRAVFGYNAVGGSNADSNGHGTHCAGTIASRAYGVAKSATVVAVKVFAGSSGSTSTVLNGFNWAANDIVSNGRQNRAVISMSLGGGFSQAFNNAVASAYNQGVTSVVAAGNDGANAANYSPASAPQAITVGAHDSSWNRASFSNFGSVVDVFAAGVGVLSTWIGSTTATNTISGTSMACPHVAGLALYLQVAENIQGAANLANRITSLSTTGRLGNPGSGSPNRVANNGYNGS